MKIGEIKIEALRLMFITQRDTPSVETLDELTAREEYGSYLASMDGSIRRCYADLLCRGVLDEWPSERENTEECDVNEVIAVWIPYWIAGELFREDEPELAAEMWSRYEREIGRMTREAAKETVYSLTEV